ncbi:MAG: DUF1554 domain-containing protein [Myxococcales bacterium]|nr:DUF1554 domain-containing protein [Myxococcales bacterium]
MREGRIFGFLVIFFAVLAMASCGGSETPPSEAVSVNTLDGRTNIAVNSVFRYTFDIPIDESTVTEDSYFIVPIPRLAQVLKADIDPALCDPANALGASLNCNTLKTCDLTPEENLDGDAQYAICLTDDIYYLLGRSFTGFMARFTTAAATVQYQVTPSGDDNIDTLNPSEAQTVNSGESVEFTVTAKDGYTVYDSVGRTCPAGSWEGNLYTTGPITEDCTVEFAAEFTANYQKIFVTNSGNTGKFAGDPNFAISNADAFCMNDSNYPGNGVYKAMIVNGVTRNACTSSNCETNGTTEHIDWVLLPDTTYVRADLTKVIGRTTDKGIFNFNIAELTNAFSDITEEIETWTGLDDEWRTVTGYTCQDWTEDDANRTGYIGLCNSKDGEAIAAFEQSCDRDNVKIVCVEQIN